VAGFDWAYDLTPLILSPIAAEGIGYTTHPYSNKRPQPWEPKWEEDFGFATAKYPIIATEFGGFARPPAEKADDARPRPARRPPRSPDRRASIERRRRQAASGALPPGFPPVEINGELYWDGGLVSNTPMQYILDYCGHEGHLCIFQVDLFGARGPAPATLLDVAQREKDIRYSSRTRLHTDLFRRAHGLRAAVKRLSQKMPPDLKNDPDWLALSGFGDLAGVTIVQLIHRRAAYETQSKDYEFSRASMEDHWKAGAADVTATLTDPDWLSRTPPEEDVVIFDCTRELDKRDERRSRS